jgi:hypothetical protein
MAMDFVFAQKENPPVAFYVKIYKLKHGWLNTERQISQLSILKLCLLKVRFTEVKKNRGVVLLTHQWGSSVAVTTMTSSLKKASWSELTALQSTRALTLFWVGLL